MHIIIFINFEPTKYQIIFQGLFKLIICRFTREKKCRYNLSRSPVVAAKYKLSNYNKVWFKDNNRYLYYSYCFFTFSIFPFFWFRITATNFILFFFQNTFIEKEIYKRIMITYFISQSYNFQHKIFFNDNHFSISWKLKEKQAQSISQKSVLIKSVLMKENGVSVYLLKRESKNIFKHSYFIRLCH